MPTIEGLHVRNYGVLKDVKLGRLLGGERADVLTPLTAVIGKNGSGKSTLFDAFGFLADCLDRGVEEACELTGRGGFQRLVTNGVREPIQIEVTFRQHPKEREITYEVGIGPDEHGRAEVVRERLKQRRKAVRNGRPFLFLALDHGKGSAWSGESLEDDGETSAKVTVDLTDARHLGITTLANLREHPRITAFRDFIRGWYLSYFSPDAARDLPLAGAQRHLNARGDNLGNYLQFLNREHPERLRRALADLGKRIPGLGAVEPEETIDGRLVLKFRERGFSDPFLAQRMSDGSLKYLAYLLLLEDPEPPPFIGVEEPENGLHHKLLSGLAAELRRHAEKARKPSQVFVTTHQPYFVDALRPEETWILEKTEHGWSTVRRAADDPIVNAMVAEGQPLGSLWYSDYFDRFDDDAL